MGKYWRVMQWKMLVYYVYGHLVYFMPLWYIVHPFDTFLVNLMYFSRFGILHQEKSGNPGLKRRLIEREAAKTDIQVVDTFLPFQANLTFRTNKR
jgi:hypothetical protein